MTQKVKDLPAVQETWVQFLSREDPLEKRMVTYSRILAWRIPRTGELGGQRGPWDRKESDTIEQQPLLLSLSK